MKKGISLVLAVMVLFLGIIPAASAEKKIPPTGITIKPADAILGVGKTLKLKTVFSPKNTTETKVKWISSDESVATVSKGKVKGIKPGTVKITAQAAGGDGVEGSAEITVVIPATSVKADKASVELAPGATFQPTVSIEPADAGIRTLRWKSSNNKIAAVDDGGAITALKPGKCTVTGTTRDGSELKVTIKVKVSDLPEVKPEDNGVDIEPDGNAAAVNLDPEETDPRNAYVLSWEPGEETNMDIRNCSWITDPENDGSACPVFRRRFEAGEPVESAELQITSLGVYEASLNGKRVSGYVLAPGWTSYEHRLQVQKYDVTELIEDQNTLSVTVGGGWYHLGVPKEKQQERPLGLIALLIIRYEDGTEERISTDESWEAGNSPVVFSGIYDGETYDARVETKDWRPAAILDHSREILIPQEGEIVRETERVTARRVFRTPAGEILVDFGQEITGYVEFSVDAKAGDTVSFVHGETLNRKGNFYNDNYRTAKAEVRYICRDGVQTWHPRLTFFGFRYIKLTDWPGTPSPEQFVAVAVHSDLQRTGWLESGSPLLNRLFSNIAWSARDNFLDIPTDCPQRDERLGWTGDAQVFIKAASYLFDTQRFFRKWLRDMAADQRADGGIPHVIPDHLRIQDSSAAWADAATICPWQLYQTYGDSSVLSEQFDCMVKWVNFITSRTTTPGLWTGGGHYGDWLGLDAARGSYKGATRDDFIATAFYAHSTELVIKAGKILGIDVSEYEALYERIVAAFRNTYPTYQTQTEYALAIHFHLAEDPQKAADELAKMVSADGTRLRTGFVGTPYILHALSSYGHADLAWDLLLRETYPGWLYPLTKGATTIWEHWDSIREDGSFWGPEMNSLNHYAYGSVADWVFEKAAGIRHDEEHPGFSELIWQPLPDKRAGWLTATLKTQYGQIRASWRYEDGRVRYELDTPVPAQVMLPGEKTVRVSPGNYTFWGK